MGWLQRLFGTDAPVNYDPASPALQQRAALEDATDAATIFQLPAVVAARGLMAETAATLPMSAYRDNGQPVQAPVPMLRRPDPSEPYYRTIERLVNQMTRHGGAVLEVLEVSAATQWPLAVRVVENARYRAYVSPTSHRIIEISVDGVDADPRRFKYVPYVLDDGPLGQAPLLQVQPTLEQALQVFRWASGYYGNPQPPYALTRDTRMAPDEADMLGRQWLVARAERRPPVISGGFTLSPFTMPNAADAALHDAADRLDAHVARVCRIPPSLLNTYSHGSLTYSTTAQEWSRWLLLGLYPNVLARIEAAFSELLPRGQHAVFDTSNLTRDDMSSDALSSADDGSPSTPAPGEVAS